MKTVFFIISITCLLSCSSKTPVELEDESLLNGYYKDTLSAQLGLTVGMPKGDIYSVLDQLGKKQKGRFDVKNGSYFFYTWNRDTINKDVFTSSWEWSFYYDQSNKLYRVKKMLSNLENKYDWEGIKKFEKWYMKFMFEDVKIRHHGTQDVTGYWLESNLRHDYVATDSCFQFFTSDIPSERTIIAYNQNIDNLNQERRERRYAIESTIEYRVAENTVDEYYIAARQGDKMQTYVECGMVCVAFLQAHDEENYRIWKHTEDSLARSIGMPTYR